MVPFGPRYTQQECDQGGMFGEKLSMQIACTLVFTGPLYCTQQVGMRSRQDYRLVGLVCLHAARSYASAAARPLKDIVVSVAQNRRLYRGARRISPGSSSSRQSAKAMLTCHVVLQDACYQTIAERAMVRQHPRIWGLALSHGMW